jgi:hypothetical protein
MVASDGFAEFVRDQLAPLGRVTMRRMFGKTRSVRRRGDARDGEGQHALLSGASATRCSDGALASVATLSSSVIAFVIAMAVGTLVHDLWYARSVASGAPSLAQANAARGSGASAATFHRLLLRSAKIAPPPSLLLIKVNAKAGGLGADRRPGATGH